MLRPDYARWGALIVCILFGHCGTVCIHFVQCVYNGAVFIQCVYKQCVQCIYNVYRLYALLSCVPIIRDGVSHCQEMSQRMRKDISHVQDHHHHHHHHQQPVTCESLVTREFSRSFFLFHFLISISRHFHFTFHSRSRF